MTPMRSNRTANLLMRVENMGRICFMQDLDVNYVAEMLDKLQDGSRIHAIRHEPHGQFETRVVVCSCEVFVKKQSYVTHEHFNSELKRLRGKVATMGAAWRF